MNRKIRQADLKLLWCRSGGRCAICRKALSVKESGGVVGEMAHVVAAEPGGPRGDSSVPAATLDRYDNLVLLCPNHHSEVDGEPSKWSTKRLRMAKRRHEQWVQDSLTRRLVGNAAINGSKCLFVIAGPAGVGKDVIIHRLVHSLEAQGLPAASLRRYTTRSARPGEVAETPFTYLTQDDFDRRVTTGEIGCIHTSLGHTYGCDPHFARETPKGCAIFYSMRRYDALEMIKQTAEAEGLNVRKVLLLGDAESLRCRILMRSVSEAEKSARIDGALQDLTWLDSNSVHVEAFFDLVVDNSDCARIREVSSRVCDFVSTTLTEIAELAQHLGSRT